LRESIRRPGVSTYSVHFIGLPGDARLHPPVVRLPTPELPPLPEDHPSLLVPGGGGTLVKIGGRRPDVPRRQRYVHGDVLAEDGTGKPRFIEYGPPLALAAFGGWLLWPPSRKTGLSIETDAGDAKPIPDMLVKEAAQHLAATKANWDAASDEVWAELRQAARDGRITVWGRPASAHLERPYKPMEFHQIIGVITHSIFFGACTAKMRRAVARSRMIRNDILSIKDTPIFA
jgi:hypothetical protein